MIIPVNFKEILRKIFGGIDWILFLSIIPLLGAGLITMNSFVGENYFFDKQIIWIAISITAFFALSLVDFRFLKRADILAILFLLLSGVLVFTLALAKTVKGAQSWLHFGFFSFQPSDPMKVLLIIILAKYFSRRHIEIAHIRHILVSGLYAFIPFVLVFFQPDFGSAIILFFIWLGMIMVSGVSKKHLLVVTLILAVSFMVFWLFVFKPYQKTRIMTFLHPIADIHGAGYNANQSTIAVGSGQLLGKGVGYGTQSRLKFLPEYQTDFIFAAFAEEWGFGGVLLLFILFGIVIWRILVNAMVGATNFEMLFGMGLAILFMSHIIVNAGMNMGLLPVTGIPMPFLSYGGSHLLTEFIGLGILMGMRRYGRASHRDMAKNEFLGV
ncbi:MAG: rod shape-determining protein RodA [Candidatus Yonathbacteria bacterium]|nr:rod shape-determining protein RodA [Candidatus Yonathbacteria bacterium]